MLSVVLTLALYGVMLWTAPWVTLLKSDRLVPRITNRYRVDFLQHASPPRPQVRPDGKTGLAPAGMGTLATETEGTLPVEDTLTAAPVETPLLTERMAAETLERAHDLAPEPERVRSVDARILEIAQETARRDIDIARRLVRPSPDFTLPEGTLPALRSRDILPEDIALEPARIGPGLLARPLVPPTEETALDNGDAATPAYDPKVFTPASGETEKQVVPRLERTAARTPVEKETEQARQESDYTFMDDLVDIKLDTYLADATEPGYFRLRILPRKEAAIEAVPKDITFILDASRSMQQRKLDLAARGVADTLAKLRPEDTFNILIFRDTVTAFRDTTVFATPENQEEARTFLDGLESRGQTNVYNALLPIAQIRPRENLPGIILVATDGNPTAGERDNRTIINAVTESNSLRNTIFTYGSGNTVNTYLLDLLAYRNKGETRISENIQNTRSGLDAFTTIFNDPLLVNIAAEYGRGIQEEPYPRVVPDFFRQRPITLYGRFEPGKDDVFVARITGQVAGTKKEILFRAELGKAESGNADIARNWAFQKAYHLIGEISRRGEQPELVSALNALHQRYQIKTAYSE